MANKVQQPENDLMVETKGKLELFFDKYGNKLLVVLACITIVAVCGFVIYNISHNRGEKREAIAGAALANVINAAGSAEEFAAIVEEYSNTQVANTAAYMAGASYLEAGDLENAKLYLAKYENVGGAAGEILNALVYSLRGDIAVEENDLQSAVELFKKAASASDDSYSFITYNERLALVYAAMGDEAASVECYKNIVKEYPATERQYQRFIKE